MSLIFFSAPSSKGLLVPGVLATASLLSHSNSPLPLRFLLEVADPHPFISIRFIRLSFLLPTPYRQYLVKMSADKMEVDAAEAKLKTMEHSEQHYFKR